MKTQRLEIRSKRHKTTGLIIAFSDDLQGLMVPGRSEAEIIEQLPAAIREILEARGETVVRINLVEDVDQGTNFTDGCSVYSAELVAA